MLLDYTAFPTGMPTSASSWTTSESRGTGHCVTTAGFHRYRIELAGTDAMNELPLFNTHLADMNFGYDRLITIAEQQTRTWLGAH
ncbi:hypothetical protein [Nocardia nova]|uniref:hypothetical protein n=1 Tax=Nocardia nova TaxID=37330 RepID=UPI0033EBAFC3